MYVCDSNIVSYKTVPTRRVIVLAGTEGECYSVQWPSVNFMLELGCDYKSQSVAYTSSS